MHTPDVPPISGLLDFSCKVVLITGAAGGIGQGIATRFAAAGAQVAAHYHTSAAEAEQLIARITAAGGRAAGFAADLTDEHAVAQLLARTIERFGRLDVLVNNAARQTHASLLEMSVQEWDAMIAATLRSVFLCTQAAARQMIAQNSGGAIVNVTSIEAERAAPTHSHYNAAKAGVLMHTRAAANELGLHGIRVNALAPGLIWREGLAQDWPEGVARWQQTAPLQRLGQPEDIADACLFLASPASRWISGANLVVDGGVMSTRSF